MTKICMKNTMIVIYSWGKSIPFAYLQRNSLALNPSGRLFSFICLDSSVVYL